MWRYLKKKFKMIKFAPNKTILKILSYNQMDYWLLYLACFMKTLPWSKYRCDTYVKSWHFKKIDASQNTLPQYVWVINVALT